MNKTAVRNNSPDPTKYHRDVSDIPGTMIPRSDKDGQSLAFDANKPQVVIVDPGEEEGGFSVDFSTFSSAKSTFNREASKKGVSDNPSRFFKDMAANVKVPKPVEEPIEVRPTQPADLDLVKLGPISPFPQPDIESLVSSGVSAERDVQVKLQEEADALDKVVQGIHYQDNGPSFSEICSYLDKQSSVLAMLGDAVNKLSERTSDKTEPVIEIEGVDMSQQEQETDGNFVDTKIPFLTAKPQKPQYETYFEMEKMGTMAARYHAVVPGQDCIALIYDTRFEDGFQYLPPSLAEEKITVSVPKLNNAVFKCSSLGLHWSLGCLDVVILIKHEDMS